MKLIKLQCAYRLRVSYTGAIAVKFSAMIVVIRLTALLEYLRDCSIRVFNNLLTHIQYSQNKKNPLQQSLQHRLNFLDYTEFDKDRSRHMVVCRAAQEAGAPHREYIYRKKVNAIFTPF